MQSAKLDFLNKYNELISLAVKGSQEFPDSLCEYICLEYDLQAVLFFKVIEDSGLLMLGKSTAAKKTYIKNNNFYCNFCKSIFSQPESNTFDVQQECEIQATDVVNSEGCLLVKIDENDKVLLKISKKTEFTQADKDNIKIIAESLSNIVKIWLGRTGGFNFSSGQIISDIAHELRTPINSIMGFASLLNEDNLTSTQGEYVSTLKQNSFNLLSLLNDIIDIAKIETGTNKETRTAVNIKSFVEEIIKLFREKIDVKKLDFITNFDKDLPELINLDNQKLRYILLNIITYSLRLTERGKITISVSLSAKDKLNFKITDTSSGLPSNKLKELFNPFSIFELGNNKLGTATGLGLTLSKKFIQLLNGYIEVSSSIGKGILYNFNIEVEVVPQVEKEVPPPPKPVKKNKVLVVEDDYATSKLLSNYLVKWGYDPTIVNSAEKTLKIIEKESFLAILLDIVLPDTNGLDLLKKIREFKHTKNTPVIICSIEAEQQKAFLMGAVEYLEKPIQYKYLVEILQSYKLKKESNVLIVDDDVPTLSLIIEAIEQAGYVPVAESDSTKVMGMIQDMSLDIAIIDLEMPELNGYDLIKQIKITPKFAKLPIVIYTGKENYEEELQKIDGLFDELLEKNSTNIENLADTIHAMINSFDDTVKTPAPAAAGDNVIKILLVEDYKHSQIIVTRLLKKNSYDHITVVENGLEAVEQVQKEKFDLILMDMQMPVMNGFEATEKIRQMPEYKETPIIALTAFAMKGDREKCLEAGVTDYIPKPIDSHEFIEKVKHYTENKVTVS
ncbi:MAG TPA: response regulator [Ignavibacteriaceae bacterium]|nr:response regulator [Ignavibacteriaceae bacterium]